MKSEGYKIFIERLEKKRIESLDRILATLVFLEGLVLVISWRLLC